MEVLKLKSLDELKEFCRKMSDNEEHKIRWVLKDGRIYFEQVKKARATINSNEVIVKMLKYADDIERIV